MQALWPLEPWSIVCKRLGLHWNEQIHLSSLLPYYSTTATTNHRTGCTNILLQFHRRSGNFNSCIFVWPNGLSGMPIPCRRKQQSPIRSARVCQYGLRQDWGQCRGPDQKRERPTVGDPLGCRPGCGCRGVQSELPALLQRCLPRVRSRRTVHGQTIGLAALSVGNLHARGFAITRHRRCGGMRQLRVQSNRCALALSRPRFDRRRGPRCRCP
jgi:hypothetical protein